MVTKKTVAEMRSAKALRPSEAARESPSARAVLMAAGTSGSTGTASLTVKSNLQKLEDDRPVLFISLHRLLIRIASSNASDYRSSAKELLTLIENKSDFPTWYKGNPSLTKSKGEVDMTDGPLRGKKLLEHAERSGEPVEYDPIFAYGHDFYEIPSPPDPIYSFIRGNDWILGFQIIDIEPFLARHGIHGFEPAPAAVIPRKASGVEESAGDVRSAAPAQAESKPPRQFESTEARQERRFDRYTALGGRRLPKDGGGWKAAGTRGALAALAREEAGARAQYCDVRDVACDLNAEAARRRANRAMPRG